MSRIFASLLRASDRGEPRFASFDPPFARWREIRRCIVQRPEDNFDAAWIR
jgi:hypothetical protein